MCARTRACVFGGNQPESWLELHGMLSSDISRDSITEIAKKIEKCGSSPLFSPLIM